MGKKIIKVFQDYNGVLSCEDLERASDSLVRARICGTEVRVGFNFLQRLLNEVLETRREDAELFAEVDAIWQEVLNEDSDKLPPIPPEVFERSKARIFEAIGLTDSEWKDHETVITGQRIPSEVLTSSEKTAMSENAWEMVQIYDPGYPPSDPEISIPVVEESAPEIKTRKSLPPPMLGGRRKSIPLHSAAHQRWSKGATVRWNLVGILFVICLLIWGTLAVVYGS